MAVSFNTGDVQVIEIPQVTPASGQLRKPETRRNPSYVHPSWLKALTPGHASETARIAALRLGESLKKPSKSERESLAFNAGTATGPGRWLIDSGAAVDLLGRSDVPECMSAS